MRQPEQVKRDLTRSWLVKAKEDLNAANVLLSYNLSVQSAVGFHSQQAAEKFLKALLTWYQIEFPKTHNLGELLDLISKVNPDLADSLHHITALNPYGIEYRYPADLPEVTPEQARSALDLAETVQQAIQNVLPSDLAL